MWGIDRDNAVWNGLESLLDKETNSNITGKGKVTGDGFHKLKNTNKDEQKTFGGSVKVTTKRELNVMNFKLSGLQELSSQMNVSITKTEKNKQKNKSKLELGIELDATLKISGDKLIVFENSKERRKKIKAWMNTNKYV